MHWRKLTWPQDYRATALFMALAAVLFMWDPLFTWLPGQLLGGGDMATQFVPWQNFIFDSLRQFGALPLWNPYLFSGVPFAANSQTMMFYPFTYLGLLMPVSRAMALTLAIHIWLAGLGMYGWLRCLDATHAGAFLGAVALSFTGTFSLRLGFGQYGVALQLAWWPLSFWALHIALSRRAWQWAILSGAPLAMGLLTGNASMIPLLFLALMAYAGYIAYAGAHRWRDVLSTAWLAGLAVATSLALAAVQYLPLLTLARLSTRASAPSFDFSARYSLPFGHLLTLLIPNFFGEPIRTGSWSVESLQEITHYVGLLVVLVAVVGIQAARQHRLLFFLTMALGALVVQLGPDGVLFVFLYRWVPGLAWVRGPGRFGLIYTFAVITAAGLAWSELERASQDTRRRLLRVFDGRFIWILSTLTISATLTAFILYGAFKTPDSSWTWHVGNQLTRFIVLVWAIMALFAAWQNDKLPQRSINVLAAAILTCDLWSYGLYNLRPGRDELGPLWSQLASSIPDRAGYRVMSEGKLEFVQTNNPLVYRTRAIYGYDPLIPARYQALLDSAPDHVDRVYDLLNVRWIATTEPLEFPENSKLPVSFERDGLWVYRRPNPLPRAFIVHEAQSMPSDAQARAALHTPDFVISRTVTLPAAPPCALEPAPATPETAQVVAESPNHLELTTRSSSAGLLVLSETDYPGWQARIDGRPAQVLRADTALRAVCLPAGTHTVRFDFVPRDLIAGAVISGLAWAVVAVVALGTTALRTTALRTTAVSKTAVSKTPGAQRAIAPHRPDPAMQEGNSD